MFQLCDALLSGCEFGPEPSVLRPHVAVNGGLPGRLNIISPLCGVAYSHGLSTPFRATRLTRVSPKSRFLRYVRIVNDVNKRQRVWAHSDENLKSGQLESDLATLTESYTVTFKTP
ncbi:hypothetical protein HYPGJ_31940 [Hyphomicrobium sp. GJ21]|nr:hypothetical protein HYPGJ_31940 [Hyphomicrobium sp. GJ21]